MTKHPPEGLVQRPDSYFRRKQRQIQFYLTTTFRLHFVHFLLCFLIIGAHMAVMYSPIMMRFEYVVLDFFFRNRSPIHQHPAITHIDIAEDSLQALGRWPWPRHNHAALARILREWGAQEVVFDVIFSEPSTSFDDEAMIESLQEAGNVYLPLMLESFGKDKKWIRPLPEFRKAMKGTGHINISPDSDGAIRRVTPFVEHDRETHPYIAVRVAYDYLGESLPEAGSLPFPTDSKGDIMINWAGKWRETFTHLSFVDVIKSYAALKRGEEPVISPEQIKGKICVIGLTAVGLTDIKANPLEETYPAVGVQTNIINSILTKQFVHPASKNVNRLCLLVVGVLVSLIFIFFRQVFSFIVGLAGAGVWFAFTFAMFSVRGIWLFALNPMLMVFSLFIFFAVFSMTIGRREQERLFNLATRDGLTGLYVIRHFRMLLNEAVVEARRKKEPLSLILTDLDHFKKINDTYGHVAGDAVLRRLSALMTEVFASENSKKKERCPISRYGGEEFIIMVKNCPLIDAAFNFGEKLRKRIEQEEFIYEGKHIPLTISIGVSSLAEKENVPDLMVHRADEALYRAKNEGRNRTCIEKETGEAAS